MSEGVSCCPRRRPEVSPSGVRRSWLAFRRTSDASFANRSPLQAGFLAVRTVTKYGGPWRAEFNYSSNVKPRRESKIFTDFGVNQSGMWRIDAGEVGRYQSALVARILVACYF